VVLPVSRLVRSEPQAEQSDVDYRTGGSSVQIALTGRHIEITDSMRDYAEEKLTRLTRFYDRIEKIDVVLDREPTKHRLEVVMHADHRTTFVAQVEAGEFYEAVDLIVEKLERQLKKHKEIHRNRKHQTKPGQVSGETE
jgi:ribosome hibernation promoting factor